MESKYKEFYRRNLPHWHPPNAVLFLTCRLEGSLPKTIINRLRKEKESYEQELQDGKLSDEEIQEKLKEYSKLYFGKYDELLDNNSDGPHWLKQREIACIWEKALFHFDQQQYKIICSTVMSNHTHFIFYKLENSMANIMKGIKGVSAYRANKILDRRGSSFWQEESFDRWIRDRAELKYYINYVLNNPVKANLVKCWKDWEYNYIHPDFLKYAEI